MNRLGMLWISIAIIVIDQISKLIVRSTMHLHESIPVLGNFFRLTYVENDGMAFGISFGNNVFFTIFATIASIAILIYFFKMKGEHSIARLALAIIFGGAVGNLLDRLFRGSVVDFLDAEFFDINIPAFQALFFRFPGYSMDRWPVYNVADIAVTVGMVILLLFVAFEKEEPATAALPKDESEMIR